MNDLLYNRKQRLATEEEGAGVGVEGWEGVGGGLGMGLQTDWTGPKRAAKKKRSNKCAESSG